MIFKQNTFFFSNLQFHKCTVYTKDDEDLPKGPPPSSEDLDDEDLPEGPPPGGIDSKIKSV